MNLVRTQTSDGIRLEGSWQPNGEVTALLIHGNGGSFYSSNFLDGLCSRFNDGGCSTLVVNTRGHDVVSIAATSQGSKMQGAAFETVDECRNDISGWLSWLGRQGSSKVLLVGHSLGALKILYAQAYEPDPLVGALVAISPPQLSHDLFVAGERREPFLRFLEQANRLVEDGQSDQLMNVSFPMPMLISAVGYLDKYGGERYNLERYLGRIRRETLITLGGDEVRDQPPFRGTDETLRRLNHPRISATVIPGANHTYQGCEDALWARISEWLAEPGRI